MCGCPWRKAIGADWNRGLVAGKSKGLACTWKAKESRVTGKQEKKIRIGTLQKFAEKENTRKTD